MKVLILSGNTGGGHNSAATSVAAELRARGDTCDITDALGYLSGGMSEFISNWHVRIYRFLPKLFNAGYKVIEKTQNGKEDTALGAFLRGGAERLAADVTAKGYDWVLSTHPFTAYMFTTAVKKCALKVKSGFIATDYTCSPFVDKSAMDVYFIPHAGVKEDFVTRYVPEEKLVATGLPVRQEFYKRYKKSAAKRALRLPENKANILLMCGSMGCGPLKQLTEELAVAMPSNAYLTVICGSNKKLKSKLNSIDFPRKNVRVVGYTKNMNYYMDSAEMIVTKAGGITCTEAMVKRLPMVLINAVGGCEAYNRNFFIGNGGAIETSGKITDLALMLLGNPELQERMARAMESIDPGNGAVNICNYLHGKER